MLDLHCENRGNSESRRYGNDISEEEKHKTSSREGPCLRNSEVLYVCLIFEDATDGIGNKGEEKVLNRQRSVGDDMEMICEVVSDVRSCINEEHPLELK